MNFSVTNNRLKLNNGYDVSGSINTSSLLVGTSAGINPTSTLDVSGTANISGNLSVDTNTLFVNASNNRIGIGTTTPANNLNIVGNRAIIQVEDSTPVALDLSGTGGQINLGGQYRNAGDNVVGAYIKASKTNGVIGDYGHDLVFANNTYPTTLTEKMIIKSNGRVGVGTSTPQAKLDVATGNDGLSAIFSSDNGTNNFNSVQLRGGTLGSAVNWQISKDRTLTSSLQIAPSTTNGGTTFATPIFTIKNDGNVGIGNDNPLSKFVVGNSMGTGYGATIDSSGTQFGTIVRTYSSTPSTDNNASLWLRNVNTTTSSDTTLFRVNNNGNVGIGTNTPQTALSIAGTTGQLNHYVYNTTVFGALNTWYRVAQFTNNDRTDINLFISTIAGGAYGTTKVSVSRLASIKVDWSNVNNQYAIQGVRLASESGITYLEVLSNSVAPIVGISSSYITGTNFTPLEFTSTTGSVASNTFLFANFGSLNGGSFVSTLGNFNYNILTDSIERMRVTSTGNVGIGTTTPSTALDVSGTGRISGNFIVDTNTFFVDASNNRVGVGTTTPSEKLNINSGNLLMNGTFDGVLMNPGTGAGSLAITRSGNFINNVQQINAPYTDNVGGSSGGGAQISLLKDEMTFSTYPNTGTLGNPITLTERMRIKSTGVGINTTNPVYKLQVEGSGTANEVVGWFNNQGAFSSSIAVRQAAKTAYITNHNGLGTPNYDGQLSNAISYGVSSGASPIQFWNGNTGVGSRGTAKMTILENGNVGIGTTTPAYPLDVSGSAKMTTIRDSANLVGTSGQVLSSTGSALSWIAPPSFGAAVLRETTSATTNSNVSFTNNVRTLRQINEIQFNSLGITLTGTPNWTITIPTAGTYMFRARGTYSSTRTGANPFGAISKLFIRNETLGLDDWIVGENSRWVSSDTASVPHNPFNYQAECNGIQPISGLTVISLRQVCNDVTNTGTKIGGTAVNLPNAAGVPEIYATLEIQRIA